MNRIIIDSKFRQSDSKSTSDFRIELSETVNFLENTYCTVTDITLPVTWLTVETDVNDKLYVRMYEPVADGGDEYQDYIVILQSRNYTRTELAEQLTDQFTALSLPLTANDDPFRNLIRIFLPSDSTRRFMVFTNQDLATRCNNTWKGLYFAPNNPQSINNMIGNTETKMEVYSNTFIFEGGSYNGIPHHTIYLICPQLGTYKTLGPQGERNILKRILITTDALNVIQQYDIGTHDSVEVPKQPLKSLNFQLVDVYGNNINLHGQTFSFALLFRPESY